MLHKRQFSKQRVLQCAAGSFSSSLCSEVFRIDFENLARNMMAQSDIMFQSSTLQVCPERTIEKASPMTVVKLESRMADSGLARGADEGEGRHSEISCCGSSSVASFASALTAKNEFMEDANKELSRARSRSHFRDVRVCTIKVLRVAWRCQ